MKIALINCPFFTVKQSNPALSLFKSLLKNIQVSADVIYLNMDFFNTIKNFSIHEFLTKNTYHGDWLASRYIFNTSKDEDYFAKCNLSSKDQILLLSLRKIYEDFCHNILKLYDWNKYDAFAFSANMGQNVSALGISKILKDNFNKKIFFGGYGVYKEIAEEILTNCPWIDAAFWNNADKTFIQSIHNLKFTNNINSIMKDLNSTCYRDRDNIYINMEPNVVDQNEIPVPDFSDYLNKHLDSVYKEKWCNIEFSRGCYYGESVVCTFCSEPGLKMKTKPKTENNAIEYLKEIERIYPQQEKFTIGDSLLPQGYIEGVLDKWAKIKTKNQQFFVELKPYITPKQIKILKDAGVSIIQPGIENFHPEVLKLLKKGHKSHHGVSFLNFCNFFNIDTKWNYLILIPNEKLEWCSEQTELVKQIKHLTPPNTIGRIIVTKHTPYSEKPQDYGINIVPDTFYPLIYPESFNFAKLCWNYDYDYKIPVEINSLLLELNDWIKNYKHYKLEFLNSNTILDTRIKYKEISITDKEYEFLLYCSYPRSKNAISKFNIDTSNLEKHQLIFTMESRYVSLVSIPNDYNVATSYEDKQLIQIGKP